MKIRQISAEELLHLSIKKSPKNAVKPIHKLHSNAENDELVQEKRKRGRPKKVKVEETMSVSVRLENRHPARVYTRQDIQRVVEQTNLHYTRNEIDDNWNYEIPVFTKKDE